MLGLTLSLAACGGKPAAPPAAAPAPGDASPAPVETPATSDVAPSPDDAAPPSDDAGATTTGAADVAGPGAADPLANLAAVHGLRARAACAGTGDRRACSDAARYDAGLADRLAVTIYTQDDMPGLDAVASNRKACELGDWRACAFVADYLREDARCPDPVVEPALTSDAATSKAHDDKAHALADKACEAGDLDACRFAGLRAMAGCGRARDWAGGLARLQQSLGASIAGCEATSVDDAAGPAGGPEPGAKTNHCGVVGAMCAAASLVLTNESEADTAPRALEPIAVSSALASSVLPPWKGYRFDAEQLLDGDLTTSWQPFDKKRGGVGQWIELRLPGAPVVSGLDLANGLQKVDELGDLFLMNNRVSHGRLRFSDGSELPFHLPADRRGLSEVRFAPRATGWIRIEIDGIHRGSKWNDLALSEVRVLGPGPGAVRRSAALPKICEHVTAVLRARCRQSAAPSECDAYSVAARRISEREEPVLAEIAEVLGKRCDAARDDDPQGGSLCRTAAWYALLGPGAERRERGRALFERACGLGDDEACGLLGCHDVKDGAGAEADWSATDGMSFEARLGERAPPALCEAACEASDDAACLARAGAIAYAPAELELDNAWVGRVLNRAKASCADGPACLAAGRAIEAQRGDREPLGLVQYARMYAVWDKACQAGVAAACDALADLVTTWGPGEAAAAPIITRACEHGSVTSCAVLVRGGQAKARGRLEAALATLRAGCEEGDVEACVAALGEGDMMQAEDKDKVATKAIALLEQACEADAPQRCEQAAQHAGDEAATALRKKAVRIAGKPCLARGECEAFCGASSRLLGKDFLGSTTPSAKELAPVLEQVPPLEAEHLDAICREVELWDPCSCGCC